LAETFTEEYILELQSFVVEIAERLEEADEDFKTRRRIIDFLDVRAYFYYIDGREEVMFYCDFGFGKKRLTDKRGKLTSAYSPSPQPGSEHSTNSHAGEGDNCIQNYKHNTDCRHNLDQSRSDWFRISACLVGDYPGNGRRHRFHRRWLNLERA
jgi:hypothetical protein